MIFFQFSITYLKFAIFRCVSFKNPQQLEKLNKINLSIGVQSANKNKFVYFQLKQILKKNFFTFSNRFQGKIRPFLS